MQKDGKFLEKQVMLSHINAPRLGRRLGNGPDAVIEQDQVNRLSLFYASRIDLVTFRFVASHMHSKQENFYAIN
jgi:hypothetical protein